MSYVENRLSGNNRSGGGQFQTERQERAYGLPGQGLVKLLREPTPLGGSERACRGQVSARDNVGN